MSELATLARPYAVAAYKRAKETGTTQQWSDTLGFLAAIMGDENIAAAASNPKANREQFTRSFLDLCQGRLDGESENFVRLLVSNRRLSLLKQISEQFEQYRADEEGYVNVSVWSAYPVDDGQRQQLEAILSKTLGKSPRLDVAVDESLIGGVLIKAGDRVIDASVRGQIQRLAKILN
jgi:F-type H+-transporting ATPase subunit delta